MELYWLMGFFREFLDLVLVGRVVIFISCFCDVLICIKMEKKV